MTATTRQGARLGKLTLLPPLRIVLQPDKYEGHVAMLEPAEICSYIWGWGATPAQAISDLAEVVNGFYDGLLVNPDAALTECERVFQQTLTSYAKVQS